MWFHTKGSVILSCSPSEYFFSNGDHLFGWIFPWVQLFLVGAWRLSPKYYLESGYRASIHRQKCHRSSEESASLFSKLTVKQKREADKYKWFQVKVSKDSAFLYPQGFFMMWIIVLRFSSLKFIIDQYVTRKSRFLGLIKEIHDYF